MKKLYIIFLFLLFYFFHLQILSKETGILYLWYISGNEVWKKFGDEDIHQKYNGEIRYGKPHGLGINIFLDGRKYLGEWKDGERHGEGILIFHDGNKLKGYWRKNKPWNVTRLDLKGRINDEYIDGVKQKNNKIDGELFFHKNKDTYAWYKIGNEKKDYKYNGQIENGKPNGWGTLYYPTGHTFEGQFKEGMVHGKGKFSFKDGKNSIGQFKSNKPWNVTEFDNESRIIGKYIDGIFKIRKKKTGVLYTRKKKEKWIWFLNNNDPYSGKYVGEIRNGKPHGIGLLTLLNGAKYSGNYKNGKWNGSGILAFANGDKWEGKFKEDLPWEIKWYDKSGNIIAKWEEGIKVKIRK